MSIITPLSEHEQNIVHVSTSSYVTPFEKLEALNEIQADENTDPDVKAVITNIFETNQAGLMLSRTHVIPCIRLFPYDQHSSTTHR